MKTGFSSPATFTRPADATAYAAGDVVGAASAIIEFPIIGPIGGDIILTLSSLRVNVGAIPAVMTSFRLPLYSAPPPSAFADNTPWDLTAADRPFFLGYLDLGSPADMGSTLFVQVPSQNLPVKLGASTASLYSYLVTNGAYTPGASDVYALLLASIVP